MNYKHWLILAPVLAGCTQTQPLTYWDKHAGSITVHHVIGKTDQTETLTAKELKNDQIKGGFKVVNGKVDFKPAKKPEKKSATERQLADRVDSLTKQVASLKEQIHSSKRDPEPDPPKKQTTSTDEKNATAEAQPPNVPVESADAGGPEVSQ